MTEKINKFLDSVCANIEYKPVHQEIRDELTIHVNELKEDFIKETQNEDVAIDMAISAMGDCNDIGRQLNKRHKPETAWSLIGLTAVIAVIGGIVMYISSRFEASLLVNMVNFERYLIFAILGTAVMVCLYFFDYTKLEKFAWLLYILSLALLMVILLCGAKINGSMFFIIGGTAISTGFTTALFLISFAGFIDKARGKGRMAILKLCFLASISALPILIHSFTQALILLIGYAVLIVAAVVKSHFGGSRKQQFILLGILSCLGGSLLLFYCFSAPYRVYRLLNFTSRWRGDPIDGYQQALADKWLMASNLFGTTTEKINGGEIYRVLPGTASNYIIVNVFATLGSVIGIILIIAIAAYIVRMFVTTKKIKNDYGFYLSLAACTVLSAQLVMGVLVNFNLFPVAGVYIPFISYGGVGYITSMALIGLILSVRRRDNLIPSQPKTVPMA